MNHGAREARRVVAINPTSGGFGFVVFEGPERLIDWGVVHVRPAQHSRCLERVSHLLDRYEPETVVLEDHIGPSRRCQRVRTLLSGVTKLAQHKRMRTRALSRQQIRKAFSPSRALTKHGIATVVASRYVELSPRLPPPRKPWMSEDERMSIFDAAALTLTFFHFKRKLSPGARTPDHDSSL